jgi:RNA polymerase sigma-70 factor (sigma-E family)
MTIHVGERTSSDQALSGRLEQLYVTHAPMALRFAFYVCGDRERAHDLVQDAFVKVAGRFAYLRTPERFDVYLRRTIVNLHTSRLRRLKLEREHLARERAAGARSHEDVDVAERDDVWEAIRALPDRQRTAIVLRYYEDLSEREAAATLGCSVGALNQLVVRATASLRKSMGDETT